MTIDEAIAIMGPFAAEDRVRLKTRYRRLALLHHPDRNGCSAASYVRFTQINNAYHLLDDLLEHRDGWGQGLCTACGERPARLRGLDRNPYCRDCLVYAGGRRLLPAPPTVIASCAFAGAALMLALVALAAFLTTAAPTYGLVSLVCAGAGLASLAASAILIGRIAHRPPRLGLLQHLRARRARRRVAPPRASRYSACPHE